MRLSFKTIKRYRRTISGWDDSFSYGPEVAFMDCFDAIVFLEKCLAEYTWLDWKATERGIAATFSKKVGADEHLKEFEISGEREELLSIKDWVIKNAKVF